MKRKAILIGSPGNPYLAGVETDIHNMKNFLCSAIGGGWDGDTEIIAFGSNPSFAAIEPHITSLSDCDFAFVYYSGHGFTDSNNQGQINLNDTEIVAVQTLANRCKKQITIIDACRNYPSFVNAIGSSQQAAIRYTNTDAAYAKSLFENFLFYCPDGRLLINATQPGLSATDTAQGGYFSNLLFMIAQQITQQTKKQVISMVDVFDETYLVADTNQKPTIECTDTVALNLPFAFNPLVNKQIPVTTIKNITRVAYGAIGARIAIPIQTNAVLVGGIVL